MDIAGPTNRQREGHEIAAVELGMNAILGEPAKAKPAANGRDRRLDCANRKHPLCREAEAGASSSRKLCFRWSPSCVA